MAIPSSLTLDYDAILSTTLFNYRKEIEDQVSTSNVLFYMLKNKEEDGYKSVASIGDRAQITLMYELGSGADTYSGYDTLPTSPTDGITSAFFDWRQAAIPISISRLEERKNSGEAQMKNLLKAKTKQATLGIQEFFAKMLLWGDGINGNAITSNYASPSNASQGIDPLAKLIAKDPTAAVSIGNIAQNTYTWWRNQYKSGGSVAATYAAFKKELRNLNNNCAKGPGGAPNLHLVDQNTFEYYEECLSASHRNPSYQKADIPFDSIGFKGQPVTWDEFMPNWEDANTTLSTTKGTWVMINTKFWEIDYDAETNFITSKFKEPTNQDAKVAHILWLGAAMVSNRRKQGVLWGIDTTVVA